MSRIRSDRRLHALLGALAGTIALAAPLIAQTQGAQADAAQADAIQADAVQADAAQVDAAQASDAVRLLSSEVSVSRAEAVLNLELSDGRRVSFEIGDDRASINGDAIGPAPHGDALDASWRELLGQAMQASSSELPALLIGWEAPADADSDAGRALDSALENALAGVSVAGADGLVAPNAPLAPGTPGFSDDSVSRLVERITVLQAQVEEMEGDGRGYMRDGNVFTRTFGHIGRGIAGIISLLVTYAVLFGIGFATIVLGGRKFIEGVGDTARHATVRSGLVGLAACFLIVPAFVLGIIALTVSIIGIPALLVFVPLFPLAVVVALLLGYLGVAHAAGEAFAERRYSGEEWYRRGNSYYFLLAGLGVLFVLFLAAQILELAPFLGFIQGILVFLGCALTWAAITIGFGAVLLSRGGTRSVTPGSFAQSEPFTEETHV